MTRLLLTISIFIALFFSCLKVQAQSQTVTNGNSTTAITMPGTGCTYNWVNDTPGIGLAASGTGDISSFKAINTSNSPITGTITATAIPNGYAYIASDILSGAVSVVNTVTNTIVDTIQVGHGPSVMVLNPNDSLLYVENTGLGFVSTISVINTSTNTVINTSDDVDEPSYGMTISPDGSKLYVASVGSYANNGTITVFDAKTLDEISIINLGFTAFGIGLSPNGNLLYVANLYYNNVSVYNTATNALVSTINVGEFPFGIAINPNGRFVYVGNQTSNTISVINTSTNTVEATVPVGTNPYGITVTPDGSLIYVANSKSNTVSVINSSTNTVIATIGVGQTPLGVTVSPDGSKVYVTNQDSDSVSIIDTKTNMVISTISVGEYPDSFGNFVSGGTGCSSTPIKFTVTVNPTPALPPTITASTVTGTIAACVGSASATPQVQQFTVSGNNLTGSVTATAPTGFEVSLAAGSSYGNSISLTQSGGTITNTTVYVRSAASDPAGPITGDVSLTSAGATTQTVAVTGTVNALPTVNPVAPQTVNNGATTAAVNFSGTGSTFNWVNDTPGIGLAASGTGDIASFTAVNTGSSPVRATITATPVSVGYAYIANAAEIGNNYTADETVSVINTTTNAVVATITVGASPLGVSVTPDGSKVYVANDDSNDISVISTATNTVIATIPVGVNPRAVTVTPDGSEVFVGNINSNNVSVISTATNMVTATITVGTTPNMGPVDLAVSPDGKLVYIVYGGGAPTGGYISIINTATNTVSSTIPLTSGEFGDLVLSPDGSRLYVTNPYGGNVIVISTVTKAVVATITVANGPGAIAINPGGNLVYVANSGSNNVSVINTATNAVIATVAVGSNPNAIAVTPDGNEIYVPNSFSDNVSMIDAATNQVINTIAVGTGPEGFGNFIKGGSNCPGVPIAFTITVNPTVPSVITAAGSPSPLNTIYGTASTSTIFTVSGANMTAGVLVSPPPGFEVSTDDINFSSTVTIGAAGTITATTVYIRLASSTHAGNYSGNIVLTSAGAATANIAMPLSTVTRADLTITADNKSKTVGEANPMLTVSYNGFVNNDGPAQLTTQPLITTTATTTSPVGQYTITASGASSPDYTIVTVPGILTVTAVPLTVVIPNTFTPNADGINDTWDIKYIDSYPNCTVEIFNRYGENIYSSIGYGTPWNGTYKGTPLPTSTYYYIINLKDGSKPLSGFIAIIR